MPQPYADIAVHLPVEIAGIDVDSSTLTICGADWTLTVIGDYEGTIDGRSVYADDHDLVVQLRPLVGEALLGVGAVDLEDTGFQFSVGVLFVPPHPTASPWRLRLPQDEFYGRPGAP